MKSNLRLDCAISLIYIMKSKGPSIDHWGTPVVLYYNFESVPEVTPPCRFTESNCNSWAIMK